MSRYSINSICFTKLSIILLAAILFIFFVLIPKIAGAQGIYYQPYIPPVPFNNNNNNPGNYNTGPNMNTGVKPYITSIDPSSLNYKGESTVRINILGSNFTAGSVSRWNGSNRNTTYLNSGSLVIELTYLDMYSSSHDITVYNPSSGEISNQLDLNINNGGSGGAASVTNNSSTTGVSGASDSKSVGSLAAGAILGTNSFLPSGVVQWLFLAVIIMLGVILWRKIYVGRKEEEQPLKHA